MVRASVEVVSHEALDQAVNVELFNDIIHFILLLSDMAPEEHTKTCKQLSDRVIWFWETNETDFQGKYRFRYLGELLERYEERFGTDLARGRCMHTVLFAIGLYLGILAIGYAARRAACSALCFFSFRSQRTDSKDWRPPQ